jgi:diacylglycerol kinase (ATP)
MRIAIIANPAARTLTPAQVSELQLLCRNHCENVEVHWTIAPGHGVSLARSTADSADLLLAVGGDGTAREVVHGLCELPDPPPTFIVPAGTANSCYRSFWGEVPWQQALRQALSSPKAHIRHLDLARLEETGALVLAGASTGFPPQAIHNAESLKHLIGRARYEWALTDLAETFRPYLGRVLVDNLEVHKGSTMLVNIGGSRYRGGQFEVLPHSIIDDGLLDICVIAGHHAPAEMLELARAGQHVTRPGVTYARGRKVTVESPHPLWFEHDGEVLLDGSSRFTLTVVPQGIPLLVGPAADQGRRQAA